ncbi:ATP-binding cassette subfamily C protein [Methylobacterium sp. BE186]|uniref:type I secretion system permease/ATPase n=1 Tax=Methylobacterium sp. BE186 TaxID=2817715 RepID=UPI002857D948|nr:type I secretion system permease/ATPase [Methylobacterium sp. BE186]MDR7035702.1 ATP-binding cassette subfamily C protein [Methylobacterium sp. BE186]
MKSASHEIGAVLSSCRSGFISVAVTSGLVNVLYLTGSLFMLVVYDRVLPSRSIPSLVGLVLLALMLYAFQGMLEAMRGRMLARIAAALDDFLSPHVFKQMVYGPREGAPAGSRYLPMQDLDQLRAFLSGSAPAALCDLPWMPIYFGVCFLFHPLIGVTAVGGALFLFLITMLADRLTRRPLKVVSEHAMQRSAVTEAGCRNSDLLIAMGMQTHFAARWNAANHNFLLAQQRVSDISGAVGAISKVSRMALQSGVLAISAYLVITGDGSTGVLLASSLLLGRALAPLDSTIANWKTVVAAQQAWKRLGEVSAKAAPPSRSGVLSVPSRFLKVAGVSIAPPGAQRLTVKNVSFALKAGQAVAVIGPSGCGKSTLIRGLLGVWSIHQGAIQLDGIPFEQWAKADIGRYVGYLPQEVALFAGTIAQNIARFSPDASPEAVEKAAKAAGIHEFIQAMPEGYETELGEGGVGLSGGQRQRVGLARALYGEPFLVVLDEPNANLDNEGDAALTQAILGVRARGGVVILVAHRMSALAGVDLVLSMNGGQVHSFGRKDEVLQKLRGTGATNGVATKKPAQPPSASTASHSAEAVKKSA